MSPSGEIDLNRGHGLTLIRKRGARDHSTGTNVPLLHVSSVASNTMDPPVRVVSSLERQDESSGAK